MIDVDITAQRADELKATGYQRIPAPAGRPGLAFVLTGPGTYLAKLAYADSIDDELPAIDPFDMSRWDIAILRPEQAQS